MGQITHNLSNPNDGFGDALREAFDNQNTMNTELYDTKVDEVAGKGLSENDFTDALKDKLENIDIAAQINVQADWFQEDDTQDDFIKNKPDYLNAIGSFHYADLATQTTPFTVIANVPKKLTNDGAGDGTNISNAPYGVPIMLSNTGSLYFGDLSIGDLVTFRLDAKFTTTGANQTYSYYIVFGVGSGSEFTRYMTDSHKKTTGILNESGILSFDIENQLMKDYYADVYIVSDRDGTIVINDFYFEVIRKNINVIDIDGLTDLSATRTPTNVSINSSTGTPAVIGLGNGTNAGFSLNDYTATEKAKLADTYIKSEVDAKLVSLYKFKGNVANYASLPSSGQVIGDVWNLTDTGGNYAWTGTVWDELGTSVDISGKENSSNKTATVIGNESSTSLYLNILGAVTYFQQKLTDSIFGAFIIGLTAKATPIDADSVSIVDSTDSNKAKKTTFTQLKAFLFSSPTFTGSVVVPNATTSTQAVNKGQLDAVSTKVSQYNTYFINTATGNNATGVFEDASKPFATIDYVNANFTIADGTIFYLQGTGKTYAINNQLQIASQSFIADDTSTNTLDFSGNSNTNISATQSVKAYIISITMRSGFVRNNRSGGTGVNLSGLASYFTLNLDVKDIYWNASTLMYSVNPNLHRGTFIVDTVSCAKVLTNIFSEYLHVRAFVCLSTNAMLLQTQSNGWKCNIRIDNIYGTGSYLFSTNDNYIVGDISTTVACGFDTTWGQESYITFNNSVITGGGIVLPISANNLVLSGVIRSITSFTNLTPSGTTIYKFINFTANFGTNKLNVNGTSTISFENCSIKSTNSPLGVVTNVSGGNFIIKNSTFEVVNAVPLMTGGAGGTRTLTIAGVSTNATALSDQNGTGVTVTQYTNY